MLKQVFGCECKSISPLRNVLLCLFCGRLLLLLSFFNFMEKSRFKRLMSNLSHHPSDPGFCSWHLTNYRRSGNPPFIFPSALHSSKYTSEVSSSKLRICILHFAFKQKMCRDLNSKEQELHEKRRRKKFGDH